MKCPNCKKEMTFSHSYHSTAKSPEWDFCADYFRCPRCDTISLKELKCTKSCKRRA